MIADPLTTSTDAPTALATNVVTWDLTDSVGKMRKRLNAATTLADSPEFLVINHFTQGSEAAGNLADRHLIQFSRVERDTAGKPYTQVCSLTFTVPRISIFGNADVQRHLNMMSNFSLTAGRLAQILGGQS